MTPAPHTLAGYAALLTRHVYDIAVMAFRYADDSERSLARVLKRRDTTPALWQAIAADELPRGDFKFSLTDESQVPAVLHDPRMGLGEFVPTRHLYADHVLCVGDIARALTRPAAAAWCKASAAHARRLNAPGTDAGIAAEYVIAWRGTADRYLAAMAAAAHPPVDPDPVPRPARTAAPAAKSDRLSVRDAAARAGVSTPTVYGWCEAGVLAHSRVGAAGRRGRIVILAADLDTFLASLRRAVVEKTVPAPTHPPARSAFRHFSIE